MTSPASANQAVDSYDDIDFVPQDSLPSLEPLPPMPAPPGQNPFRIKGLVLAGLRDFIGATVPGGFAAVLARIEDPAIHAYMQQQFLTGSWYDILPYVHFLSTSAAVARWDSGRFVGDHGAWQIERDMKGIHRLLLRVASPDKVAARMGESFARYFDVATVTVLSVGKNSVRLQVRGMPAALLNWYKISIHRAAERVLTCAGARSVRSGYAPSRPDGEKGGMRLIRFQVERTWST